MAKQQNIAQDLYDLLATRGFDPETTDETGQPSQSDQASVMSFDYVSSSGKNYGTAVVVMGDGELMLFYGDNLGKSMEKSDKDEWFQFLQQLSQFATRHDFNTFSPRNLSQLKHTMAGLAAIKEGLFEGYYGNRRVSYTGEPTQARLMIRHNRELSEEDARYRYIESLFIETNEGERFRLGFTNLSGGRAMLEHVRQGGRPYDVRGVHITEMVNEIQLLARFNRASRGRVLEGVSQTVVETAQKYYQESRENLRKMATSRGYQSYFESWTPADVRESEALVEDLRKMFLEQTLDNRIEAALPLLAKLQGTNMKEAEIFETWANSITEGTWALPDNPESKKQLSKLMSSELIVGPDALDATQQLYDIFGDDELFDRLSVLAQRDPDADARDIVRGRAAELGIDLPEPTPTPTPAPDLQRQPAPGAQDNEQVEEGDNLATFVGPNEDSTDAMDHRGAVTDSFYENLSRLKQLITFNKR